MISPEEAARARKLYEQSMTEDQLLSAIVQMAHVYRWLAYHVRNSRRGIVQGDVGFPDLIMARPPRLIVAELKDGKPRSMPTMMQAEWLDELRGCGAEAYLWRPIDWLKGDIQRVLR